MVRERRRRKRRKTPEKQLREKKNTQKLKNGALVQRQPKHPSSIEAPQPSEAGVVVQMPAKKLNVGSIPID